MILRTTCDGKTYRWVEKGERACLIIDEGNKLLWWGEVGDPKNVLQPSKEVPLEVLLALSILRTFELT